ncbi:MAG TPA: U32 family peptidase [Deltaproteobacteria bacterium]|nr:U32 family peptidase [Deltaproteobacteria bacterium]
MKTPEILAPAGNMEALESACLYGADAVYLGVKGDTNLRAGARNFTPDELEDAVKAAHDRKVRVYLTLNTYPHDTKMTQFPEIILHARSLGIDAVIVSDIGVLDLVKEIAPDMPVHLSTQANAVNTRAIKAWAALGVSRVILARELSHEEITHIRRNTGVELELFVHGSVCISISGRCLISNYLCGRDANQGACTQPCRWDYALMERTRPGEHMPIEEDEGFTYLYNSKDLCLLPVMDKVMGLGVEGLKIEGRNKTSLYIATVVSAYMQARDAYIKDPQSYRQRAEWMDEISKISNRGYFGGFFMGNPGHEGIDYNFKGYTQSHHLAAKVLGLKEGWTVFEARNPLIEGMVLEWLSSAGERMEFTLRDAFAGGSSCTHIRPGEIFEMKTPFCPVPGEFVRKLFSAGDKVVNRD